VLLPLLGLLFLFTAGPQGGGGGGSSSATSTPGALDITARASIVGACGASPQSTTCSNAVAGDRLFVETFDCAGNSTHASTAGGWTLVDTNSSGNTTIGVFTKVAAGSDTGTFTSTAHTLGVNCYDFVGVRGTPAIDAHAIGVSATGYNQYSVAQVVANTVTPNNAKYDMGLLITILGQQSAAPGAPTPLDVWTTSINSTGSGMAYRPIWEPLFTTSPPVYWAPLSGTSIEFETLIISD
jgi:hypothetical protein